MEFTDYVAKVAARGQFENNAISVFWQVAKFANLRGCAQQGCATTCGT